MKGSCLLSCITVVVLRGGHVLRALAPWLPWSKHSKARKTKRLSPKSTITLAGGWRLEHWSRRGAENTFSQENPGAHHQGSYSTHKYWWKWKLAYRFRGGQCRMFAICLGRCSGGRRAVGTALRPLYHNAWIWSKTHRTRDADSSWAAASFTPVAIGRGRVEVERS